MIAGQPPIGYLAVRRDTKGILVQDMHPDRSDVPASPVHVPAAEWLFAGPLLAIAMGCAYFVAADLSMALVAVPEQVAVFWPASGLAAGALVALGPRARLPVALSVIGATLAANLIARSSIGATIAFALCNALECLLAAWLVKRLDPQLRRFETLRSVFAFVLAATAAPAMAAIPAALALQIFQLSRAPFAKLWFIWFKSDALGILVVAPLIITLAAVWRRPPPIWVMAEGLCAVLMTGLATAYAFGVAADAGAWPVITPAAVLFPMVLWLASRLPPFFSAAAVLLFTLVISWTAFSGQGRLGDPSIPITERILAGQLAMLTFSVVGLAMAAAFTSTRNLARALAVSEERLRFALNAASSYAFDHDLRTNVVHRVGGSLAELDLPQVGGTQDLLARMHPDDHAAFRQMLGGMSPASPLAYCRFRLRKRDGSYIYVGQRAEARYDHAGKPIRIIGTSTDVTRRELQEQALSESEARLKEALRAGRVFAFEWSPNSQSVRRSENAVEILGIMPEQAQMSRNALLERVPAEDRVVLEANARGLTPARPFSAMRYRYCRPDGRIVWLEVIEEGLFDADGKLERVRGLTRDVTALKLAEERQDQLIAELDHRVKNTLARVGAVIERSREGHETVESYAEALKGRIDAMARTHDRLRSNAWSGVDIGTIVADEIGPYRNERNVCATGPKITLSPDAAQAVSLTVHELATNAAKHGAFSRDDGHVSVSWSLGEEQDARTLRLVWSERTAGAMPVRPREGFGLRTIRNLLEFELGADVSLEFTAQGVECTIAIPAARAVVGAAPH